MHFGDKTSLQRVDADWRDATVSREAQVSEWTSETWFPIIREGEPIPEVAIGQPARPSVGDGDAPSPEVLDQIEGSEAANQDLVAENRDAGIRHRKSSLPALYT